MTEVEVSLRLALFLLERRLATSDVRVAIDGAQVRTGGKVHFRVRPFLANAGFQPVVDDHQWQGAYSKPGYEFMLQIHSRPGVGDVVARVQHGQTLRVECKKGSLSRSKSSAEYRLLREALGQLLTIKEVQASDLLAVAVPDSPKFRELIRGWTDAPLVRRMGVRFLAVSPSGAVSGFDDAEV